MKFEVPKKLHNIHYSLPTWRPFLLEKTLFVSPTHHKKRSGGGIKAKITFQNTEMTWVFTTETVSENKKKTAASILGECVFTRVKSPKKKDKKKIQGCCFNGWMEMGRIVTTKISFFFQKDERYQKSSKFWNNQWGIIRMGCFRFPVIDSLKVRQGKKVDFDHPSKVEWVWWVCYMSPLETSKKQVDYLHVKPLLRVMLSNLPRKNRDIQMYNIYIYGYMTDV